jgi:hypothetical protein
MDERVLQHAAHQALVSVLGAGYERSGFDVRLDTQRHFEAMLIRITLSHDRHRWVSDMTITHTALALADDATSYFTSRVRTAVAVLIIDAYTAMAPVKQCLEPVGT